MRIFFLLCIFNCIVTHAHEIVRDYSWKKSWIHFFLRNTDRRANGQVSQSIYRLLEQIKMHHNQRSTKILLYGPPGNGKTTIAHNFAEELNAEIIVLKGSLIVGSYINQGATTLQKIFEEIREKLDSSNIPVVLFIDEIDQIARKSTLEIRSEHDSAIHTLWLLLDDLKYERNFVFIGATNSFPILDPAFVDRFGSNCIEVDNPDNEKRKELLIQFFHNYNYSLPEDLKNALASSAKGLSIRSLENLVIACFEQSKHQESIISDTMIWEELHRLKKRNDLIENASTSMLEHWQILSHKSSVLATILGSIISFVYLTEKTITYLHNKGML